MSEWQKENKPIDSYLRPKIREWLGIDEITNCLGRMEVRIATLENEVARLKVAQYVPPQTPEPKREVIPTHTMKQYLDIVEREFIEKEAHDAV